MKIQEVLIENYLCYYGRKKFKLSGGLNIVLGENGEGKTKFFEALEWLFKGGNSNLEQYISAKAISEANVDDRIRVKVSITVQQYYERKILTRQFVATKISENELEISNPILEGIEENERGERTQVDGNTLLDQIFPYQIRRYSMFKGEEELNIFDQDEALINLINLFSEAKYYDKYEETGEYLKKMAEKAVDTATKKNTKDQAEYNRLEKQINLVTEQRNRAKDLHDITSDNIEKTENNLQDVEKYIENAEALETINKRIRQLEDKITELRSRISENYTTLLFDEQWLLINFEPIHKEFTAKVNGWNREKRKLQSEFDKEIGRQEGEKKAKRELLKDVLPLPVGTPSRAIMEEMLKDEICKVCNRPAQEGSEPYKFMYERLREYLSSQELEEEQNVPKKLFPNNYVSRLVNHSTNEEDNITEIRKIRKEIKEQFDFNEARRQDVIELESQLEKELVEREKIIGKSSEGSERLSVILKDYNKWQEDLKSQNKDKISRGDELKKLELKLVELTQKKEKIDLSSAHSFQLEARDLLRDIEKIFRETKSRKFSEFIELLSRKANDIFTKINIDAFTGVISFKVFSTSNRTRVKIELVEEDGKIFYKPNQSLKTSMHISILLAISDLSKEVREEGYPLIFDAPTSSFGESKMTEFLNLIYDTSDQIVILIKDFLVKDEYQSLKIKEDFERVKRDKSFWVRLQRPFDKTNLSTIETEVIEL